MATISEQNAPSLPGPPTMHRLTENDIDAAWSLVLAVAPNVVSAESQAAMFPALALHAMHARLALRLRMGSEYVVVRRDWREKITELERCASTIQAPLAAVQGVFPVEPDPRKPAQTMPQDPAGLQLDGGSAQ